MKLQVHLHPPLNDAAGTPLLELALGERATVQTVIDELIERFGPEMRRHLYDTEGRIVPAWCVFVNRRPVQMNRPEGPQTLLAEGDELTFLLNIAGG
jgi:molybdopterin converting factor small subunit